VVTGESAIFLYKTTDYYAPAHERTIVWNDPSLAITWPVAAPIVNAKDAAGMSFKQAPTYQ
jgi:dTDP-4-dehydrorhamnose 3,5-epimerase